MMRDGTVLFAVIAALVGAYAEGQGRAARGRAHPRWRLPFLTELLDASVILAAVLGADLIYVCILAGVALLVPARWWLLSKPTRTEAVG